MEPPDFGDSSSDSDSDDEGLVQEGAGPPGQAERKRKAPGSAGKDDGKAPTGKGPKKKRKGGLIDDAAVESGDEDGDDEDDEVRPSFSRRVRAPPFLPSGVCPRGIRD